jgi:hypothetical protein
MSQRFSEYARRERDDYPTPDWVTETVIPHLKAMGANTIWEPAAGEGSMADALLSAGFRVVSTDLAKGRNCDQVCFDCTHYSFPPPAIGP